MDYKADIITIHRFDYDFKTVEYKNSNYYRSLKYALYDNTDIVKFLQQFAGAYLMSNARLMKAALIISVAIRIDVSHELGFEDGFVWLRIYEMLDFSVLNLKNITKIEYK